MGSVDLIASCLDSIRQVGDEIPDSIVYIDAGTRTLEAFQFIGAFPLLLELGARAVCTLENSSPLDAAADWNSSFLHPGSKIVVITSCLLSDAHRYILRCLGNHGTISHCTVLTSVSEVLHPWKDVLFCLWEPLLQCVVCDVLMLLKYLKILPTKLL